MTTWREQGYVPASDGEESDGELSTQEEVVDERVQQPDIPWSTIGTPESKETEANKQATFETALPDFDFVPIDEALKKSASLVVAELDLVDEADDEEDDHDNGGAMLKNDEKQLPAVEISGDRAKIRYASPDPITGEPQPLSPTPRPVLRDILFSRPRTPEPSSTDSSPLSSPPASPTTPPSSIVPPQSVQRTSGFAIIIPITETSDVRRQLSLSPFFQRQLRNRKPIQVHPYALEDARYKMTMKARGMKPVRIQEKAGEEPKVPGEDSQDGEYVAPPEPERDQPLNPLPEKTPGRAAGIENNRIQRPLGIHTGSSEVRISSADGAKRRKIGHTYPKKGRDAQVQTLATHQRRASGQSLRLVSESTPRRERDVYDLLESPSPSKRARTTTGQRTLGLPFPQPKPGPPPLDVTRAKPDWFLPLDSDSEQDTDALLGRSNGHSHLEALNNMLEDSPLNSVSSSPVMSSRQIPRRVEASSGDEGEDADSNRGRGSAAESDSSVGPSKVVRRFKKLGTRGVLPASFIKLSEARVVTEDRRRDAHQQQAAPQSTEQSRPGVARTITNRARISVADLFENDSESDSGAEPALAATAARKPRRVNHFPPPSHVIDLLDYDDDSDIPEDNRIDYGLPAPERRRDRAPAKSRKRQTKLTGFASTSKDFNGAKAERRPNRHPNRRKSTGPKLGIVDAARHLAETTKAPLPTFAKVAARSAKQRKNFGRHSPARKVFILDTAEDTRDVQGVLQNWREGTLPFRASQYAPPPRIPSPQLLTDSRRKLKGVGSSRYQGSGVYAPRPRQTSLLKHFEPNRLRIVQQKRRPPKPLGIIDGDSSTITHRPTFRPAPAQLERRTSATHGSPSYRRIDDVADFLLTNRSELPSRTQGKHPAAAKSKQPPINSASTAQPSRTAVNGRQTRTIQPNRKLRRKRTPQRLDADIVERRQPLPEALNLGDTLPSDPIILDDSTVSCLTGLLPYGSRYSLNFDTFPLKPGTIFHSDTFIGQGLLELALSTNVARTNATARTALYTFDDNVLQWGVYDDSVATGFERCMERIWEWAEKLADNSQDDSAESQRFADKAYAFYCFAVRYIADIVSFHDPLDVQSFGQRLLQAVQTCSDRVSVGSSGPAIAGRIGTRLALQASTFCLIVAHQVSQLSRFSPPIREQLDAGKFVRKMSHQLVSRLARCGFGNVRDCYEDQRRRAKFERGIDHDFYVVELWVVAIRLLNCSESAGLRFWELVNDELRLSAVKRSMDVKFFESLWRSMFALIPLHQFDGSGVALTAGDDHPLTENWALVKALVDKPLTVYNTNKESHAANANDYFRIIFARCHHLLTRWAWRNPDQIIPALCEFFASNGLSNLLKEPDIGAPDFLSNLDQDPSLNVLDTDRCFHILLKIIGVGLRQMAKMSTDRKNIRRLVFRLMPNHRRQYPKDKDLRLEDLVALRNHHYLLETVYWSAPPDCRPPLEAIRLLVDPENSHRYACNVAVRAWSNLVRFQLHTSEDTTPLKELMDWFDYLITKTLGQHHAARSEAERQFKIAKDSGDMEISEDHLEDNVRRNQRQVEAILNDLIKSLCSALASIPGQIDRALVLFTKAGTSTLLNSFTRVPHKLIVEVLSLIQQFVVICKAKTNKDPSQNSLAEPPNDSSNEESQDYGDWSALEEFALEDVEKRAAEHLLSVAYDSLHHMLSNCFGADRQPEESMLLKTVDTWCLISSFMVQHGLKSWDGHLNYSAEAWSSLRDTAQTRKYTSYFMPKLIEHGNDVYQSNKQTFLRFWMKSLVERESMLRFQNEFTAAILNCDSNNPLFANPPFVRDQVKGAFIISQFEFRTGRLSLISSVLEKMRETCDAAVGNTASDLKRQYADMLRAMMKAMKDSYEELQSTTMSGAYVDFVHKVVEYLQQHVTEIVEIDRFFTDSSAFPLPAGDPNYVVGRLKKYAPKLSRPGTQKELNMFLQIQCERCALSGNYSDLVNQLTTAVSSGFEDGDDRRPTMRSYFMCAVFPAYAEVAFKHPAGWILSIPLLTALEKVTAGLKLGVDSTLYGSTRAAISMLDFAMDAVRSAASQSMHIPSAFTLPYNLGLLVWLLRITSSAVPTIAWLYDETPDARAIESVKFIIRFAVYVRKIAITSSSNSREEVERPLDILGLSEPPKSAFDAGKKHCAENLVNALARQWHHGGGDEWDIAPQGAVMRKRVVVPEIVGGVAGVKREYENAVEELLKAAARTEMFGTVVRDVDRAMWGYESRGRPWSDRHRSGRALESLGEVFC